MSCEPRLDLAVVECLQRLAPAMSPAPFHMLFSQKDGTHFPPLGSGLAAWLWGLGLKASIFSLLEAS